MSYAPRQRLDIPDIIPGLEPENPTLFAEWLDSRPDIFYRGLLADKVLKCSSIECKFIYSVWLFDSLNNPHKPMIREALSSIYLAQIFWENLNLSSSIPFVQKMIEKSGGLISFILNASTHRDFDEYKHKAKYLTNYLKDSSISKANDLTYDFSKHSPDFFEKISAEFQLTLLKNATPENKQKGYKFIALKYLEEEINLGQETINLLVQEIKSLNFTNLIKDKIFIPYAKFRNRQNGVSDPLHILFHPEQDMFSLIGIKNKRLKKAFYLKGKNTIDLNILNLLPKVEDIKEQELLVKIIEAYDEEKVPFHFEDTMDFLITRGVLANTKDEIDFCYQTVSGETSIVHDTFFMIKKMNGRESLSRRHTHDFVTEFTGKKFNIKKVHDWLSDRVKTGGSIVLHQDKLAKIDGKTIDGLTLVVAKDNKDLVATGSILSICVGNGTYLDKILNKRSMIFFLQKDQEVKYCIELSYDFNIIQAKGHRNFPMPEGTLRQLKKLIDVELKEIPNFSLFKKFLNLFKNDSFED